MNLTENDISIHEVKQAQSELAQQLGQHVAFHGYVGETHHTDPGDTVKFGGVTRILVKSAQ